MLTELQRFTLRAALDRIVPGDEFPSASAAGVEKFVLTLFETEPNLLPIYRVGLDLLAERGFKDLTTDEQDEILHEIEGTPFGRSIIQQGIEGYYGDPGNGGNVDGIGWEMVGFKVSG